MSRNLYETLDTISKYSKPTDPTIVEGLQAQSRNFALLELLKMNFDPRFVGFDLPEGAPPYETDKKQPFGYADSNISANIRKLYIYLKDYTKITAKKKEFMFQGVLESLHWREAELLIAVKDKVLVQLFPAITEACVREAFPDLLPPLEDGDLIDAAVVIERDLKEGYIKWNKYTKDEIIALAKLKRILFRFPEHAEKLGISHLADGYVEPEKVYDPAEYLSFTLKKTIFGVESEVRYNMLFADATVESIGAMKHAAHIHFDDLEKAKELGVDIFDARVIEAKKNEELQRHIDAVPKSVNGKKIGRPRKNLPKNTEEKK